MKKTLKIDVVCLFPKFFSDFLNEGLLAKAQKNKILTVRVHNLRNWTKDRRKSVDDKPYGGGGGMLLKIEPVTAALKELEQKNSYRILLTPQGKIFNQSKARALSKKKHLIIICGHYEGFDQRISGYADEEISIGDYVLSGGEVAAAAIIESVGRLLPGFMGNKQSLITESFNEALLDYPQYTRPEIFDGLKVPEVLLKGNHAEIEKWRQEKSLEATKKKRPDLLTQKDCSYRRSY